ncbi:YbaK/EbsC family protein, partial [Rhodococcus sp. NPDC058514]|uniref:YbaK/EbsC family protein n=1 Tax=Rhodococcus sp. NPDC058514 TaxID=3346532 RepID=UPI003664A44E
GARGGPHKIAGWSPRPPPPILGRVAAPPPAAPPHPATRLDGTLTRAPAETVRQVTGQPIGGVAPVGHPTNLPTYVDATLAQYPELWAAAGHPATMFRTTFAELLRITAGLAIDVD